MHFSLAVNPLEQPPQSECGICMALVIYNQAGCITGENDVTNKPAVNAKGRTAWHRCLPFLMAKASFTSSLSAFQSFCVSLLIPLPWQNSKLVIGFCLP